MQKNSKTKMLQTAQASFISNSCGALFTWTLCDSYVVLFLDSWRASKMRNKGKVNSNCRFEILLKWYNARSTLVRLRQDRQVPGSAQSRRKHPQWMTSYFNTMQGSNTAEEHWDSTGTATQRTTKCLYKCCTTMTEQHDHMWYQCVFAAVLCKYYNTHAN